MELEYNKIYEGDCEQIVIAWPAWSFDCIITDPPYPQEFLHCWTKLGVLAKHALLPGRFCIAYTGAMYLPEVIDRMSEHLNYYWTCTVMHTGSAGTVHARKMLAGAKQLLIYSNGKPLEPDGYFNDTIRGTGMSKTYHKWGQAVDELSSVIKYFTEPNDVILDPFCGAGTTCVAAELHGRRWIGIDIDKDAVKTAQDRTKEATNQFELWEKKRG